MRQIIKGCDRSFISSIDSDRKIFIAVLISRLQQETMKEIISLTLFGDDRHISVFIQVQKKRQRANMRKDIFDLSFFFKDDETFLFFLQCIGSIGSSKTQMKPIFIPFL